MKSDIPQLRMAEKTKVPETKSDQNQLQEITKLVNMALEGSWAATEGKFLLDQLTMATQETEQLKIANQAHENYAVKIQTRIAEANQNEAFEKDRSTKYADLIRTLAGAKVTAELERDMLKTALERIKATEYDDPEHFRKPSKPYSGAEFTDAEFNNGLSEMAEIAEQALNNLQQATETAGPIPDLAPVIIPDFGGPA